jgi:methionyl-tRNA formyltransferase
MMGTGTFARPTLEALLGDARVAVVGLVTQPDRDAGAKRGSTRQTGPSLKDIAVERGVPVIQPESVNTPEGVAALRGWTPDLLVVAAYGQILKREVLEAAAWGGINVHGSLLPKYRGAAPVAYAILGGESETGVTIIRMTTGLDAGDMIAQESLAIGPDETAGELEARLAPLGARLALDVVHRMARGPVAGTKQDPALVTKAPKLTKEGGLIDWSQPAAHVCRHVRAMHPWPTAYTFLHQTGKPALRVVVTKAREPTALAANAVKPGDYAADWPGMLAVGAGEGVVEIIELQPAGKSRMPAADFLRGRRFRPGDRFGPEAA